MKRRALSLLLLASLPSAAFGDELVPKDTTYTAVDAKAATALCQANAEKAADQYCRQTYGKVLDPQSVQYTGLTVKKLPTPPNPANSWLCIIQKITFSCIDKVPAPPASAD